MFSECKLNPAFAALRPEALSALYPDAEDRAAWQGVSSAGKEEILREALRRWPAAWARQHTWTT